MPFSPTTEPIQASTLPFRVKVVLFVVGLLILTNAATSLLFVHHLRLDERRQIQASRKDALEATRRTLIEQTQIARGILQQYEDSAEDQASRARHQADVKRIFDGIRFGKSGYFFAYQYDGTCRILPTKPEWVGSNRLDARDPHGTPFIRDLIAVARRGGDTTRWAFDKPGTGRVADKLGYALGFDKWGWMYGTGAYVDDIDSMLSLKEAEIESGIARLVLRACLLATLATVLVSAMVSWLASRILRRREELERIVSSQNAAIQQANEFNRQIIQHARTGVVVYGTDRRYRLWNPFMEEISGFKSEEVLGRLPQEIIPYLGNPEQQDRLARALAGEALPPTIIPYTTKDGRKSGWCSNTTTALRNAHGEVIGAMAVVHDITDMKTLERKHQEAFEQAQAANLAKSEFLANMSHEIRTPLNGVMGMLGLLLETPLNQDQREFAEVAGRSGESLMMLLNDILDLSKIEAGKLDLETLAFDPHPLIEDLRTDMAARARSKGIGLECLIDPSVPRSLLGDPGRIRQILLNLLGNAVKFTQAGRVSLNVLHLGASPQGHRLRFEVADTGIGIKAEKLPQLFRKFSQADASTTRRFGGTGLGLAISRQLVALMGGEIGVESREGEGSRFWFSLTLAPSDHPMSSDSSPGTATETERFPGNLRILLAEDNITNQQVARGMLARLGIYVDTVASGYEALDALAIIPYDLVLMDVQMPEIDGLEATRRLRAPGSKALNPQIPVIAMTANAMQGDKERCLEAGMNDYVAKPVSKRALRKALSRWLPVAEEG